jgi:hypothetical protein
MQRQPLPGSGFLPVLIKLRAENQVRIHASSRSLVAAAVLFSAPAMAERFGPLDLVLDVVAFAKDEVSFCDNCSEGLVNPSSFDPRGVLNPPSPMLNQGGRSDTTTSNLFLAMLNIGASHEFDNAIKLEAMATGRIRGTKEDIFGNYLIDLYGGVSYPKIGSLQIGKISSRSWTRSDSFAYPVGLSSPWAESGAGYGVFPEAVRYATPEFEIPFGRIRFETSLAKARRRGPLNPESTVVPPPSPRLIEFFIQFSNEKNLVELIYQDSHGGRQSSFSKGAFFGAQGDTNGPTGSPGYRRPYENVLILQGNFWLNPTWKFTYGVKRSGWSGQQQQCDFGAVSPVKRDCFFDQPGFNYASDSRAHAAYEWDAMLGVSYTRKIWVFTLAGVRMNKAYTETPTEWGQSNTATFLNLGVYRKVPEIYRKMEVYAGLGRVMFGRRGPAPLSMPSNTAFGGVDPRTSESGNTLTIGMNLLY